MVRLQRIVHSELPEDTIELAKALIGRALVRDCPDGRAAGRIVEVEAYLPDDPASHSYRGRTERNAAMFLPAHHAYVYLIYGTSFCVNVTSEREHEGAAVLVRALEPVEGITLMQSRRKTTVVRDLCRGPGRLCEALAIDRTLDRANLLRSRQLWLANPQDIQAGEIGSSRRIGITKAADHELRFYELGSSFVSGPRPLALGRQLDLGKTPVL